MQIWYCINWFYFTLFFIGSDLARKYQQLCQLLYNSYGKNDAFMLSFYSWEF